MILPETKEGFYIFTNREELKELISSKYDNVVLIDNVKLSKADLEDIKNSTKGVLAFYYFDTMDEINETRDLYDKYRYDDRYLIDLWCLKEQHKVFDDFLEQYKRKLPDFRRVAESNEILVHTDYTNLCGNCHSVLEKKAKYCKNCGTKVGEGKFEPYVNESYCVYGPMVANKYTCPKCEYEWSECNPGGRGDTYCPQCGTKVEDTVELASDIGPFFMETEESIKELMKRLEEKAKEEQK